jgi:hypothetical protein
MFTLPTMAQQQLTTLDLFQHVNSLKSSTVLATQHVQALTQLAVEHCLTLE